MRTFLFAACAAVVATLATGCATKPEARVNAISGVGTKVGLVQDPVTGQYSLGVQRIQASAFSVPIFYQTNANGQFSATTPDTLASYELSSHSLFFGNIAVTTTFATGPDAVASVLGGAHQPINENFGTGAQVTPIAPTTVANPIPTFGSGTNNLPIVIKP